MDGSEIKRRLVVRNIGWLVTMNPDRKVWRDAHLVIEEGVVVSAGPGEPVTREGDEVVNARGGIAVPGFINTHHHMFQNLARAYTPIANAGLFPWLEKLIPLWRGFTPDDLFTATQVACAELMLSGCTLACDHHYMFPRDAGSRLMDAGFEAARTMGCRYVACRGGGQSDPTRPDDWAGESLDTYLTDCQRLHDTYHDASAGARLRLALAPGSIFSGDRTYFLEIARLARALGLGRHTHLAEVPEEAEFARGRFGSRPLELLESYEWTGPGVWFAHGIHFSDDEIERLGRAGAGVAHCPCCNMRMGSGVCRVNALKAAGVHVGLGVDGSASNDSGHLLNEVRLALFLTRVIHGASAMTVEQALELATLGGARLLGRAGELGSLEPGKLGDVAIFPAEDLWSNGAENPVHALVLCHPRTVEFLIVHGEVRVRDGQVVGLDMGTLLERHRRAARRIWSGS